MRKLLFLLPLLSIVLFTSSCGDDDKVQGQIDSFAGTAWELNDVITGKFSNYDYTTEVKVYMEFQKHTFSLVRWTKTVYSDGSGGDPKVEAYNGTYEYKSPKLILSYEDDRYADPNQTMEFTVFSDRIAHKEYGTLYRK